MNISPDIAARYVAPPEGAGQRAGTGPGDPASAGRPASAPATRPAGTEPGRTTVTGQAVERIAAQVVSECPDAGGSARSMLGVTVGEAGQRDAMVAARLHGTTAVSLAVRCSVPYPRPVARATETLRQLLVQRVGDLTGLTVQRVDITVTELTTGTGRRVE